MNRNDQKADFAEVFCGSSWEVGLVKSMLEDVGIEAYVQDSIMGVLNPWYTAPGGAGSIRLQVAQDNYDRARAVVEQYEMNLKENE